MKENYENFNRKQKVQDIMSESVKVIYSASEVPAAETVNKNKLIPFINYHTPAPVRCLDMLLAKYYHQRFQSEVMMSAPKEQVIPYLRHPLSDTTLLVVTDGGLVPFLNPDRIPSTSARSFGIYSIEKTDSLSPDDFEVSHQGYDNSYVEEDPNRLLPLDALRTLESEGVIKEIYPYFLSTTGVMMPQKECQKLAKHIATYVTSHPIDAVLITSACGTSTRSGSIIGAEIEKNGIPVVQITNLTQIAQSYGITRTIKGQNICYPCGNPMLSKEMEFAYRKELVETALHLFDN